MSDAIEAALTAYRETATYPIVPGNHSEAMRAAITAYEAAKCGGVGEDRDRCIACNVPFADGELVLSEASGGLIHAACCGPERESYTGKDGGPLAPDEPTHAGFPYSALTSPASGERDAVIKGKAFDDWWSRDGQYLDPDTSDVPWFDKRRGLAEYAFDAGASATVPNLNTRDEIVTRILDLTVVGKVLMNTSEAEGDAFCDELRSIVTAALRMEGK